MEKAVTENMAESKRGTWSIALFVGYMALVFIVPDSSPWFGAVLLLPVPFLLWIALHMVWVWRRRRRAIHALARTPALRSLQGDERRALQWFGEPERIHWRSPRGNVVDLHAALADAGTRPVVRELEGPYRHLVRGQHHDPHDFIGEVEVLLLPGAQRALEQHNRALVLVCGDIAVVLALNARWKIHHARSMLR